MKEFTRDGNNPLPLYRQVHAFLRSAILRGDLLPGIRLPSTRALARQWDVSRNTVLSAYEELAVEGLVSSRAGSGTRVESRNRIPRLPDPRLILREARYPLNTTPLADPDGNPLYIQS